MSQVNISIKKGLKEPGVDQNLKLDLRENKPRVKQKKSRKGTFLNIFLLLAIIGLVSFWYLFLPKNVPFYDLAPDKAVVFSVIDQKELYKSALPFKDFINESNFYGQGAVLRLNSYISSEAGLNFEKDIVPLFKEKAAFSVAPADPESAFPFLIILEKKGGGEKVDQVLNKVEMSLKRDFNFSVSSYRNNEINVLKPIAGYFGLSSLYAYVQTENYLIIGNSKSLIESTIDKIIEL